MSNFTVIESIHGKFIVNRHALHQAEALINTGATHIEHELKNIFAVTGALPEGAVAVDAGANIGFVSVPLAHWLKDKGGVVHAFEPQRMLYYALCGTAALNDLSNLRVNHQALGSRKGVLKVPAQNYSESKDFGLVSLLGQDSIGAHETVEVVRIDDLKLPRLDFLKIDVEGMELEVLAGASETIRKHRPWCWIEHWMIGGEALKEAFGGLGYALYNMDDLNALCAPEDKLQPGLKIDAPAL